MAYLFAAVTEPDHFRKEVGEYEQQTWGQGQINEKSEKDGNPSANTDAVEQFNGEETQS